MSAEEKTITENQIELKSQEVQEILSKPPSSLVRYGTVVICLVMCIIIAGSFFFRFPDIVTGDAVITTENPPAWITARSTGKITALYCADNQLVKDNETIGVIENPASTEDIIRLRGLLSAVNFNRDMPEITTDFSNVTLNLGNYQEAYSAFVQSTTEYRNFLQSNITEQEKNIVKNEIKNRRNLITNLRKQLSIKEKEVALARKNFQRDSKLYAQKTISAFEYEKTEQNLLTGDQGLQQINASISQEEINSGRLDITLQKLDIQYLKEKKQIISNLRSAYRFLLSRLNDWDYRYLLKTSISGKITFSEFWKENQYIKEGDKVFGVIPEKPGKIIAKIKVPLSGYGKVRENQMVNIRVDGFPYLEYGFIRAKISKISRLANDKYYTADAILPDGLVTSNKNTLHLDGELSGSADIITENRSIIERIFKPISYFLQYSK